MSSAREKLGPEELGLVLDQYDLGAVVEISDFARGAHASAKVIVTTDRGRFLIKRRPRGEADPYRVAFAHSLQSYLASKNFPLPHLIGTRDENNSMLKIDDAIYEVFEFIDGQPYDNTPAATREAGRTLGIYHTLLRDYTSQWQPPISHYHDAQSVHDAFPKIGRVLATTDSVLGHKRDLKNILKRLRALYAANACAVNELGMCTWKTQIVHSDWHPGNLLFQEGHVVAVLDHEAARIRPRIMDVANGCLQFSFVAGGRDLSSWTPETDAERAREFLQGYDEINLLTKAELRVIPFLMAEVLIAQVVPPILRTKTFAGLDGFRFLQIVLDKVDWLENHRSLFRLETVPA